MGERRKITHTITRTIMFDPERCYEESNQASSVEVNNI
jgi:hypothetical protein